jgi:hypothetical protein
MNTLLESCDIIIADNGICHEVETCFACPFGAIHNNGAGCIENGFCDEDKGMTIPSPKLLESAIKWRSEND